MTVKKFTLKCKRIYNIEIDDNVSSIAIFEDDTPYTHSWKSITAEGVSIPFMIICCEELVRNVKECIHFKDHTIKFPAHF
jgi:hypothetical protein